MITCAVVHGSRTTAAELRAFFGDEHIHCALIVDQGRLVAVVDRSDLGPADDARAVNIGRLEGRVVRPDAGLENTRLSMVAARRRRLAVVIDDGVLVGLLCLNRTGAAFCSDSDVQSGADERRQRADRD
jgi:predicted transcriptional regulator